MGRKPRASKPENFQPTSAPKSVPEGQTITAEGTHLSDTSRIFKRRLNSPTAMIRRSPRIQSTCGNQAIQPIIEEIIISGSPNNDGPMLHEDNKFTEEASDETGRSSKKDDAGAAEVKYKAMYISSQKKIEALMEENKQLSNALELANGKIHLHEKQSNAYSEVMAIIGSLSRVNENLAARVNLGASDDNEISGERTSKKKKKNDMCNNGLTEDL
ncbi:uncharacterized protein LOC110694998 isoform X2 [Chenopodium quinoa]|uniref:uncharacterized protein LOC110694998 isoform X2 n=1 Tax=Chenopodium quinoa TaxID=63459 RepID=UPI000B788131|nr:uncharacterized protein LOC110694998 isoform X2 [Chenopodium quinoa]